MARRMVARSEVLASLGARPGAPDGQRRVQVVVDEMGQTTVPGVYAAGNVIDISAQVMGAAAAGTRVGAAVNIDLIMSDTRERSAHEQPHEAPPRRGPRGTTGPETPPDRSAGQPSSGTSATRRAQALWSGHVNAVVMTETEDSPAGTGARRRLRRGWRCLLAGRARLAGGRRRRLAGRSGPRGGPRSARPGRRSTTASPGPSATCWRGGHRLRRTTWSTLSFLHLPCGAEAARLHSTVRGRRARWHVPGGRAQPARHRGGPAASASPDLYFTAEDLAAEPRRALGDRHQRGARGGRASTPTAARSRCTTRCCGPPAGDATRTYSLTEE